MSSEIVIHGARLHNLKHITVRIPKYKLVVITGLSGSGKSALALDTLYREGQRQYLEALGMIAYQLPRSAVDRVDGLSPTVAVDQQMTNRNSRSTVGTETGIYAYLRLLFAKVGHRPCPACGRDIASPYFLDQQVVEDWEEEPEETTTTYPCPHCGTKVDALTMAHFFFNKLAGACPTCSGLGVISEIELS